MEVVRFILFFALIAGAQNPEPGSRVVASSADWTITAADFDHAVESLPSEIRERFATYPERGLLVKEMVRVWVLSTEARKKGMDVGTSYEARREYYQSYARDISLKITGEDLRKYYDDHEEEFTQVALSHILILNGNSPITPYEGVDRLPYEEAEKKAREIKAMLDKGGDWDELSKKYSQAMDVKDRGGAIGYMFKNQMEKSVAEAAFALKPGQISDVVGSIFGFHILRVSDRKLKPFEEVREFIRQKLTVDQLNRELDAKVKTAGVTIDENF